jgi:hypothetical protein
MTFKTVNQGSTFELRGLNRSVLQLDVVIGQGKTGNATTGPKRLMSVDTDGLYALRDFCRLSLSTVPMDNWPEGKEAPQIINDMVEKAFNCWPQEDYEKTTQGGFIANLPGGYRIFMRLPQAVRIDARLKIEE